MSLFCNPVTVSRETGRWPQIEAPCSDLLGQILPQTHTHTHITKVSPVVSCVGSINRLDLSAAWSSRSNVCPKSIPNPNRNGVSWKALGNNFHNNRSILVSNIFENKNRRKKEQYLACGFHSIGFNLPHLHHPPFPRASPKRLTGAAPERGSSCSAEILHRPWRGRAMKPWCKGVAPYRYYNDQLHLSKANNDAKTANMAEDDVMT